MGARISINSSSPNDNSKNNHININNSRVINKNVAKKQPKNPRKLGILHKQYEGKEAHGHNTCRGVGPPPFLQNTGGEGGWDAPWKGLCSLWRGRR